MSGFIAVQTELPWMFLLCWYTSVFFYSACRDQLCAAFVPNPNLVLYTILWHSLYCNCFCAWCIYFLGMHTVWRYHQEQISHTFCAQEMWHLRFVRFTACTKTIHVAGLHCNWCFLEVHICCQSEKITNWHTMASAWAFSHSKYVKIMQSFGCRRLVELPFCAAEQ